jgi:CheY-like chemotaxis protein
MSTVLLIEDDAESRRTTAELFSRENWTIVEAGDGETGIRLALEHRPELVLCDLLMPRVNGFQVCRSIRQRLQRTRIIIVSGRDYGVDRASAIEAGADEYLVKPISWENLREVIERVMPVAADGPVITGTLPDFTPPSTRLKFWGACGSIPVPVSSTVRYGGNTSCIEVRADGEIIILDAGSGMRALGIALEQEFGIRPIKLTLLISHTHWDHIQGLPHFPPAYHGKNSMRVLGYEGARAGLATILAGQMEHEVFPVSLHDMLSAISIEELKEMAFSIGKVRVEARFVYHPGICVGSRLFTSHASIASFSDNEPYPAHARPSAPSWSSSFTAPMS